MKKFPLLDQCGKAEGAWVLSSDCNFSFAYAPAVNNCPGIPSQYGMDFEQ